MPSKRKKRLSMTETVQSYAMISVGVIGLFIFVVLPLLWVLRYCLFSYKGFGEIRFVGFDNFVRVFQRSPKFWLSVRTTFVFAVGKLCVELPLALVLACMLAKKLKGRTFFRSLFFMPSMLSVAVIGVIFSYMFSSYNGVVNEIIKIFNGVGGIKFFSKASTALMVLMIASVWQNFGFNMLFFMTGLQSIPEDLYEAARIDGATERQQFFKITIPMLGPVIQMVVLNALLGSLKVTDLVLVLTDGNPLGQTETIMTYVYKQFFTGSSGAPDYGYASALVVVSAVILGIVTVIYLTSTKKGSEIY